ncbi:HD domain-containing protein [Lentibacillus saliphilus]|uniref:HD domain-containing protein n=1 Tax=Lentibacillus saliphilus TaxID=2737028 RepID=UPI001C2F4294|nr:HD domain-containing protein [Lentibacillus saliphilus]
MKTRARSFAMDAHKGQTRKGSTTPYITHPIRVAERLEKAGVSDELVCAGYLHDVVEDTPITMEDIQKQFGVRVAQIVSAHTEDKSKSWQERKQHTIETVKEADLDVKYLIVADKLDNLVDLEDKIMSQGDDVWRHFNAGFADQKWYNESIAHNMEFGVELEDIPDFFQEFKDAVARIFG